MRNAATLTVLLALAAGARADTIEYAYGGKRTGTLEEVIMLVDGVRSMFTRDLVQTITLGEDGMMLFEDGKPPHHTRTKAAKVHDVSGAGDTVISTLAVASSAGATLPEAATLANHAAGIVCGEVGVVPIYKDVLYANMLEDTPS